VAELRSLKLDRLLTRPVHAQMMAEIASDFSARLINFRRYQLYKHFVDFSLRRDFERRGGAGIPPERRRRFLRTLAWRLWFELERNPFKPSQLKLGGRKDPDPGRSRDLPSGSMIETKFGDSFYFSHQSFQEFLIAEHILEEEVNWEETGAKINNLNDETIKFVAECPNVEALSVLFRQIEKESDRLYQRSNELAVYIFARLDQLKVFQPKKDVLRRSPLIAASPLHLYFKGASLILKNGEALGFVVKIKELIREFERRVRGSIEDNHAFYYGVSFLVAAAGINKPQFSGKKVAAEIFRLLVRRWHVEEVAEGSWDGSNPALPVRRGWGVDVHISKRRGYKISIHLKKLLRKLDRLDVRPKIEVPWETVSDRVQRFTVAHDFLGLGAPRFRGISLSVGGDDDEVRSRGRRRKRSKSKAEDADGGDNVRDKDKEDEEREW
jgi:hypothetical protein